jgi:hypothetical protein
MSDSFRAMLDAAKQHAEQLDAEPVYVNTPNGKQEVKRARPPAYSAETVDPSDVAVASDAELTAMLVAELHEIRATKRLLTERDSAIKSVLETMVGEAQYLALSEGDSPVISLKHESSVRIRTSAVKELYPPSDCPDLYQSVGSRPLRLM